jgi:hypothetical protein
MMSIEPSAEASQHLFLTPGAPLGQAWLQTSQILFSNNSLPLSTLVLKAPPATKARSVYEHGHMARQIHMVSGMCWTPGVDPVLGAKSRFGVNSKF